MASIVQSRPSHRIHNGVVIGNVYDKYQTKNPIARWLMNGFFNTVTDLYRRTAAKSVLEVGCGEGRLAHHLYRSSPPPDRFDACDLTLEQLPPDLDPAIQFRVASAYELPYADREFELVVCCEVLEHLEDPRRALQELARVSRCAVLLSTPREPLWRALNLCRGRYLTALGNTPGHIQHFSRRQLVRTVEAELTVTSVRSPTPWTVILGEPKHR